MLSAIAFWLLPEEEATLVTDLASKHEIVAYPASGVETRADLRPTPIATFIAERDPRQLLFGRQDHESLNVVEVRDAALRQFALTSRNSCLIGYRRGELQEGRLTLSHLTAHWARLRADTRESEEKPYEFVRWGKNVFAKVRRLTPKHHLHKSYRATRQAKAAHDQGELELVDY